MKIQTLLCLALLALLLPQLTHGQTQAPLTVEQQKLLDTLRAQQRQKQAEGVELATSAPYVFLGRPLTGETYQDKTGRYYESTVYQVVEVLRGEATLKPGTVALTKPLPLHDGQRLTPPKPGHEKELRPQMLDMIEWGIYFCAPSTLPNATPYLTSNPAQLSLYAPYSHFIPSTGQAMFLDGCREVTVIDGLGYSFSTEKELSEFLLTVPNLKSLSKPVASYPRISFVDKRPGYRAAQSLRVTQKPR